MKQSTSYNSLLSADNAANKASHSLVRPSLPLPLMSELLAQLRRVMDSLTHYVSAVVPARFASSRSTKACVRGGAPRVVWAKLRGGGMLSCRSSEIACEWSGGAKRVQCASATRDNKVLHLCRRLRATLSRP